METGMQTTENIVCKQNQMSVLYFNYKGTFSTIKDLLAPSYTKDLHLLAVSMRWPLN